MESQTSATAENASCEEGACNASWRSGRAWSPRAGSEGSDADSCTDDDHLKFALWIFRDFALNYYASSKLINLVLVVESFSQDAKIRVLRSRVRRPACG
jgi:hypothetical protein